MPKLSLMKNSSSSSRIQPIPGAGVDKGVYTFLKGICPKMNVKARLQFEIG